MRVALALAKHFNGEVVALSVVEVPFQTPLMSVSGLPDIQNSQTILRLAERLADREEVPCRRMLKIAHRFSQGVIETAKDEDCNFIILGQSPRPRLGSHIVRTFMDQVLREALCHVGVVKCAMPVEIERITVAVEDDGNSRLALELLPALAARWSAKQKILAMVYDGAAAEAKGRELIARLSPAPLSGETELGVVAGSGAAQGILASVAEHDVIMMEQMANLVPKLLAGVVILLLGFVIARIVRKIAAQLFLAIRLDRFSDSGRHLADRHRCRRSGFGAGLRAGMQGSGRPGCQGLAGGGRSPEREEQGLRAGCCLIRGRSAAECRSPKAHP
jgi:nucleotide-binding universal stress UspA family protein